MDKLQKVWKIASDKGNVYVEAGFKGSVEPISSHYLITKEQLVEVARTADNLRNAGHAQASLVSTILKQLGVE